MATLSFPRTSFTLLHSPFSTKSPKLLFPNRITCSSSPSSTSLRIETSKPQIPQTIKNLACGLLAALALTTTSTPLTLAANSRLPPLSTDPNRCERAFVGNTIGQANGVYDKVIDLRFCDFTNEKSNIKGKTLSAALMSDAKFDGADLTEVVMSKAYAVGASFKNVDFTNAVLDRVNFGKADLQGAVFRNAVLSGSTFVDAKLNDATFEDTIIGYIDLQNLCLNTTLNDEGRAVLGCR
ncbi:Thylakoid lumenal 17.4 kDa protein [Thalictrum thalictroides]|uniref:Thylakoid lumenal 17.4 kDa protein n=1 Tax=Thalictrum thalictroides TaxID=46969 RepID=A0A7J6V5D2_THATH|nr:Thylakoid lumenal 17.4 kDa protein [Thalictrum thalictroides]